MAESHSAMSPEEFALCRKVYSKLTGGKCKKHARAFMSPAPAAWIFDYLTVVKHPMDFNTLLTNLKNGEYLSKEEFYQDTRLIFDNAMLFWKDRFELPRDVVDSVDVLSRAFEHARAKAEKKAVDLVEHGSNALKRTADATSAGSMSTMSDDHERPTKKIKLDMKANSGPPLALDSTFQESTLSRPESTSMSFPFFDFYEEIKTEMCHAGEFESREFYGHLQDWFVHKSTDPDFDVLSFDPRPLQCCTQYFESAHEHFIGAEKEGHIDACLYKFQLETITKYCKKQYFVPPFEGGTAIKKEEDLNTVVSGNDDNIVTSMGEEAGEISTKNGGGSENGRDEAEEEMDTVVSGGVSSIATDAGKNSDKN
ncbi:hypothetical protein ACHAWF_010294 [Thalassiosira exigua]